jgi:signal transduction histidine kinase
MAALFLLASRADESVAELPPLGLDLAVGVAGCLALALLRRRWPIWLALALTAAGMFVSTAALGTTFVALFIVAANRLWPATAVVAGLHAAMVLGVFHFGSPTPRQYWDTVVTVLLMDVAVVCSGLLVRSLRDRASQAVEGQRLRIEDARRLERERIAREMHDVLAHRLSLLAMHAGALEFRPQTPAAEITRAVGVIRQCAFEALEDLRQVIGVLRDDAATADPERPQPTLADLATLVADSQRTGVRVTLDNQISDLGAVPAGIGRHAYRIVQEGLTNARKHAPGAAVRVAVTGSRGADLTVELRNRLPPDLPAATLPGAGAGLVGLGERVDLVGGRLEHGRTGAGDFRLWASLPWPR